VSSGCCSSSTDGSAPPGTTPSGSGAPRDAAPGGGHARETLLTWSDAAKATAAAQKAAPRATIDRVETDSGDATYEAHVTQKDGTQVTVKLDKRFAVTAVEDGMGT
jgi:hypothetical protein